MKKILKWFSLGCLLVLLGCRADEMLNQAQQKDEMAKKFKVFFKNTDNQEVNYAEGFRYLTLRYDSLYQTNISGREPIDKLLKNTTLSELNTGTLAQTSYIDFNIRSQLITHENGNKWILFPKIVNKEVVDLAVAILTENETRFGIYILDSNSKLYMDNIDAFRKAYNQHYKSLSKKNQFFLTPMKICGQPGDECDIDEVIIFVPPPSKPFPPMGFFPPDYGGGFPECGTYADCIPPFYGGSMPRNPINPPTDPCEKAKSGVAKANEIAKNQKFNNAKNNILKAYNDQKTNNGKGEENGVAFGSNTKNGALEATEVQYIGENGGSLSNPYAYPIADMHNHTGYTPPSAGDVYRLMKFHLQHDSFRTRYAVTPDGTMYALVVTDTEALKQFLQKYPPHQVDPNISPNFPKKILDEIVEIELKTNSEAAALSYILEEYNAGISLAQTDSNGRIRKINTTKTSNANGSVSYTNPLCP